MVVLHDSRVGRQELVVGPAADESVVMVSRLGVVLHKADGHVAIVEDGLVQGLQRPQTLGGRGPPEPFNSGGGIRTPDLALYVVIEAGGQRL